jgi:Tfp pilus tip-associated adhesin PilY1
MGDTWAKPDIGKIKDGGDTKFAAFLAGGYSTTDNKGNSFYIVDIEKGEILKSFTVGDSTNKIPSAVTTFDADEDGYIDYIYFGDIKGTLWKVDVRSSNKDDWTLYEFFNPSNPKLRPIFYPPAAVKNNEGKILVFFGTGNELGLAALTNNYFYEVEDEGVTGKENWSKTLEDGEKVLASPAIINFVVYFTTWVYKSSGDFCGAGEGRLWGLKVSKLGENGGDAGLVTLDTATGKWKAPQQYISLGAGIPTAPVVTNGMVYIGTSLNANRVIQIPIPPQAVARIKSWREVGR